MTSNLEVGDKVTHPSITDAQGQLIVMEVCEVIMVLAGTFFNEQVLLSIGDVKCAYMD